LSKQVEDFEIYASLRQSEIDILLERLLKDGILSQIQIQTAKDEIEQTKENILIAMVSSQIIKRNILDIYINNKAIESINLAMIEINSPTARKLPKNIAIDNKVLVFFEDKTKIYLSSSDPSMMDDDTIREFYDSKEIIKYISRESDIFTYIDKAYEYDFHLGDVIDEIEALNGVDLSGSDPTYKNPVIKFVDGFLEDAVRKKASDIHIQPDEKFIRFRYRLDGIMHNQFTLNASLYKSVIVRLKVISGMNIAESIKPQDGGIQAFIMGRQIDFRVSLMPTIFGEGVVIRVLDKKDNIASLKKLNFSQDSYRKIDKILAKPEGVLIMTGPTGSGKTTTLYAMITQIASPELNIVTLEDPVEYRLQMARQTTVNPAAGITFAAGLRSILRQDPDIILVGEMRDEETAITAMRAAMTGHRVLSTLHTNNAPAAINRLLDLGVSRHIIASSINGIIAQRLIRKLCNKCKIKREVTEQEYSFFKLKKIPDKVIYCCDENHNGCPECRYTGFKERISVIEVLYFDVELKKMIEEGKAEHTIISELITSGKFIPIQVYAIRKVLEGQTSFGEMCRVIDMSIYAK
jgi:general secretion pathway protein E/type IV pilus assembly protein PilB